MTDVVYIVSHGERGEGGSIRAVFSTIEGARAHVWEYISEDKNTLFNGWKTKDDSWKGCHGYWVDGCDWLAIVEWEVF